MVNIHDHHIYEEKSSSPAAFIFFMLTILNGKVVFYESVGGGGVSICKKLYNEEGGWDRQPIHVLAYEI